MIISEHSGLKPGMHVFSSADPFTVLVRDGDTVYSKPAWMPTCINRADHRWQCTFLSYSPSAQAAVAAQKRIAVGLESLCW